MNRWQIYEMLKGNKAIDIKGIECSDPSEVKEAVIEYLYARLENETNKKPHKERQFHKGQMVG